MSQSQQKYDRTSFILVVDDDNTLLKFFKIHLNKFFSKVIVVKNAKEAIESLREKTIDLVISDINMPRMDGFQLMKRVRKHDTSIPVLLISGALLNQDEEELLNEADGYLRKPFNVDQLHDFINNGLLRREKMKQLATLVSDKKQLRNLLKGTVKLEKVIKKDQQDEAKALLDEISQVA
ncbi:MAG: response regulator [Oligoflexales bacterium]